MQKRNTRRGFTLIELLVVVLIIGILAAVAVPQYQKVVERSKATEALTILSSIAKAYQAHYLANGTYATKFEELDVDIPFSGKTKFLSMAQNTGRTGDTKSNTDWSFQIEISDLGYVTLLVARINGKYKGAGFLIGFENPAHNSSKQVRCFERKKDASILFDTNLPNGAYCERVMQATYNIEDTWTRMYTLP